MITQSEILNFRVVHAASADMYAGDPTTTPVNVGLFGRCTFMIEHGNGATGEATITAEACDNAAGDNPVAIPFRYRVHGKTAAAGALQEATVAGFATGAGANRIFLIDIDPDDTPESKPFVRLKLDETADFPVPGSVWVAMGAPRYGGAAIPTGLA